MDTASDICPLPRESSACLPIYSSHIPYSNIPISYSQGINFHECDRISYSTIKLDFIDSFTLFLSQMSLSVAVDSCLGSWEKIQFFMLICTKPIFSFFFLLWKIGIIVYNSQRILVKDHYARDSVICPRSHS